jgi:4-hydroxythreonine-4-phosphate dehydrogenase
VTECRLPLAVTMGEPAGIGGEIVLKAWLCRGADLPAFYVVDDPDRLAGLARMLGWDVPVRTIAAPHEALSRFPEALPVAPLLGSPRARPGRPDPADAPLILASIETAVRDVREGRAAALVTNPIQKKNLYRAGFRHPGHTEYLAELSGSPEKAVMMLVSSELKVVPVTTHVPLRRAIERLSPEAILHAGRVADRSLRRDFGIAAPVLVVAGLNPHAGEEGALGEEEREQIAPAVTLLRESGVDARGPLPADTLFHAEARAGYDAALCMFHDQALIPLKTIDFYGGVNLTLGLPFMRTSPDHGTALAIAGQGIARSDSIMAALRLAARLAKKRAFCA